MIDPAPVPLPWQTATLTAIRPVTRRVKSYRFRVAFDRPMLAGQHVDVRLTAPDGYQAQRSYSIASAPDSDGTIELLIEGLPDGEVSGFFDAVAIDGRIACRYLSLDQAMVMGALGNVLAKDVLRRAFSTPDVEAALRPVIGIEEFGAGVMD